MVKTNQGGNQVAQDAYRTLTQYIEAKHHCKEFSIQLVVFGTSGDKDLLIDGQGRLWKGTISEKWHSLACGKERIFTMIISADGKGGNFIAIAE